MKSSFVLLVAVVLASSASALVGCGKDAPTSDHQHGHGDHVASEAEIRQALAQLSPEDRKLAEEQGYCANEPESKLGSMGTPLKVMVQNRAVFVCCDDCAQRVVENPAKTLESVDRLRAKSAAEHREKVH